MNLEERVLRGETPELAVAEAQRVARAGGVVAVDYLLASEPAPDDAPPRPVLDGEDRVVAALVNQRAFEEPFVARARVLVYLEDAHLGRGAAQVFGEVGEGQPALFRAGQAEEVDGRARLALLFELLAGVAPGGESVRVRVERPFALHGLNHRVGVGLLERPQAEARGLRLARRRRDDVAR